MTEPEVGSEVSLDEAVEIAVRAHRQGDVAVAETVYTRILAVAPDHPQALHFYGVLNQQTRRPREAVRLIQRAIALAPDDASMHTNLGNVLFALDRPDLARQAYEAAIALAPEDADAHSNLGVALRADGRSEEAEAHYREAVALAPGHAGAWKNLGNLLSGQGRMEEAIGCYVRALDAAPGDPTARRFLTTAYAVTGDRERALAILRGWDRDEPGNATVAHLTAAISGEGVPSRANDAYVAELFDDFATSFDRKLARLDYRGPELIAEAVAAVCGAPAGDLAILDAGCGTGLAGAALKPFARLLEGVDLSPKMLELAGDRGVYDALSQGELTAHLAARAGRYDLVVSADTLCYFGDLAPVCEAARAALRPGGRLVFSVETDDDGAGPERQVALQVNGRYRHARSYVARTLDACGFAAETIADATIRKERGQPVPGLIVTARRREAG